MLDNRFKRGLKNFNTSNKTSKQVKNYLGKKADMLGVELPKYISDMKNVSSTKVDRFINTLLNKADKEIRKVEIEKLQGEVLQNKLKNSIKVYNKKVDNITKELHKKYTNNQVDFLNGKSFMVLGELINFDSSNGVFLEKMDINNFEFNSKEDMKNFVKDLNATIKNMTFEKFDNELLDTDVVNGLTEFYENKLSSFLSEFNKLEYSSDFEDIGERYKKLNKVQKNMFVQAYKNNMRDDYLVPSDEEGQENLERNYLNKLLGIMATVEGL